jgi:hypothetical protein
LAAGIEARTADGTSAASSRSVGDGSYLLTLAPGIYTLVVVTQAQYPQCPRTPVTISPGATVAIDIACFAPFT